MLDPPSLESSATVALIVEGRSQPYFCTGTLITDRHVLMAAHCLGSYDPINLRVQVDPATPTGLTIASTACEVDPFAFASGAAGSCEEARDLRLAGATVQQTDDFAVLTLATPVPASVATPRAVDRPNHCFLDGTDGVTLRAFGRDSTTADTLNYPERFRYDTRASLSDFGLELDPSTVIRPGDSGGTLTETGRANAPLLGLAHAISRSGSTTGIPKMALLWQGRPTIDTRPPALDFVMSVITRDCVPGANTCHFDDSTSTHLSDRDRDGIPDVADLCPDVNLRLGTLNGAGTNHRDSDGDWRGDDCDQCPGVCDMAADSTDTDMDGVFDQCDGCPDDPPLPGCPRVGCDPDNDNIPSACDLCSTVAQTDPRQPPHTPVGPQKDTDEDGLGDACDNCADDANPSQANCNLDVERKFRVYDPDPPGTFDTPMFGIGDACDDRECADTRIESRSTTVGGLRARSLQGLAFDPLRAPEDAQLARTGLRICRCEINRVSGAPPGGGGPLDPNFTLGDNLETRDMCAALSTANCTLANIDLYDTLQAVAPGTPTDLEPTSAWRRMTIDYGLGADIVGDSTRRERRLRYRPHVDGVFLEAASASWNRTADQTRWSAPATQRRPLDNPLFGVFPGVIWTHTPGFGLDASGNFDAMPHSSLDRAHPRGFTSHYWSGVIPRAQVADQDLLAGLLRAAVPFLPLPETPHIPHLPDFGERMAPSFPASFLYAKPDGTPALGFADGSGLSTPSVLPDGLSQAFGQGLDAGFWVAASESGRFLPDFGPRYAVVDAAGTQVLGRLDSTVFGLSPPDFSPNQQPPGDPLPVPIEPAPNGAQAFMAAAISPSPAAGASAADMPPPREAPLAVLSARRQQLWILGGVRSGAPARDLWRVHLPSGEAQPLRYPRRVAPQHVLAATYDASRDVLWVLDETRPRRRHRRWARGGRVRLLRLDPNGGAGRVERSWPRLVGHTTNALATDPGGGLWLAASLAYGPHVVLRFESHRGRLRPVAVDFAPRPLASRQAHADERGLSFLVRHGRRAALPAGARTSDLHRLRPWELLRCF